ncbi:helix-turn-helix domain-containing protein [Streptomyces sp. WAC 06738]|uniref:helix-turn-helix domain-containing protein n=1 Tax=Streptomyces sp. WAC 06738 TaxID=2203210 RepID=UPI0023E84CCE|nr:helix-turn-helix domain-containing protein [Streptomyces sp. WAC 06738]
MDALDSSHPLWHTPAMRDALTRRDAGAIVRLARRAADVTLADLGQAVGYTAASLSRMERGQQPMRDIDLLTRIAGLLGIPPHLLGLAPRHDPATAASYGSAAPPGIDSLSREPIGEEDEDPVRRRKLLARVAGATTSVILTPTAATAAPRPSLSGLEDVLLYRNTPALAAPEPTPAAVAAALDAARRDFAACRYDRLARALPSHLALAQALTGAGHPEAGATAVAELYNIATRLCIKMGEDEMAAATADRALTACRGGADALTTAEAHRMVSSVWRRAQHYTRATDVAVTAAQQLTGASNDAAVLSAKGNLYATAAYTAGKQGDRYLARDLIAEAGATADQLGHDAVTGGAVFGPSQVILHQISISYLLGDAGTAIEHARRIRPATLPTPERQARYYVDVARAFDQWGKPDRCYSALLAAEKAAPQEVRLGSVRTIAAGLMRHDRHLPGIRNFAARVGAL